MSRKRDDRFARAKSKFQIEHERRERRDRVLRAHVGSRLPAQVRSLSCCVLLPRATAACPAPIMV